uniref:Uncharacterized protein n=1 Tax=Spermophilus dauricus TaxID=99837 RepID=A0A8C9PAI7_SPEDA
LQYCPHSREINGGIEVLSDLTSIVQLEWLSFAFQGPSVPGYLSSIIHPSIRPSIHPSIHPSILLFTYHHHHSTHQPPIHPPQHLFIYSSVMAWIWDVPRVSCVRGRTHNN